MHKRCEKRCKYISERTKDAKRDAKFYWAYKRSKEWCEKIFWMHIRCEKWCKHFFLNSNNYFTRELTDQVGWKKIQISPHLIYEI
jgi:hypothetical protein